MRPESQTAVVLTTNHWEHDALQGAIRTRGDSHRRLFSTENNRGCWELSAWADQRIPS